MKEYRRARAYEFAMGYAPHSNGWIAKMMRDKNFNEFEIKQALDDLDHVTAGEWTENGTDIRELSVEYRKLKAGVKW